MEKLLIFDGNSLINRAYFALPPMYDSQGRNVNAVYGFVKILKKAIEEFKPDCFGVAFDKHGKNFRKEIYPEYKANRHGMPDDLACQMPILHNLLDKMKVKIIEQAGVEADDIIGTIVNKLDVKSLIVSGDRDLFQLVNDKVTVVLTKKGISETEIVTPSLLLESYRLTPSQVIEYKALRGDASDNIPGVYGIGEKTATSLILEYGNIDNIFSNLEKIKGALHDKLASSRDIAYLSKQLATIVTNLDIDCQLNEFTLPEFNHDVRAEFLSLKFLSLVSDNEFVAQKEQKIEIQKAEIVEVFDIEQLQLVVCQLNSCDTLALHLDSNCIWIAGNTKKEFRIVISDNFLDGLSIENAFDALKPLFASNIPKVMFDSKATRHALHALGVDLKNVQFDISLMQYLTEPTSYKKLQDMLTAFNLGSFASGLICLCEIFVNKLKALNLTDVYQQIELPLSDLLFRMEVEGVSVDEQFLNQLSADYKAEIDKISVEIYNLADEKFNIASPKQLSAILFEKLGLKHFKKNTTGYSTNNDVLEKLKDAHPIIDKIVAFRSYSKLNGTYVEGLRPLLKRGVVHTTYNQYLTTTGRLSSSEPNLQNIPVRDELGKEIRRLFVSKYGSFVSADYSQIELRLLAGFSRDPSLLNAFKTNQDIHRLVASEIFGVPFDLVNSQMRRMAKAVNFGIIYGQGAFGLSESVGIPVSTAKKYIEAYFTRFASIKSYLNNAVENAKKEGYVTTFTGRRRYIPEIKSQNFNVRSFGERAAMNMPLQGSAADIMKIAMIKVDNELCKHNLKSKIILQIHDEIVVDCLPNEVEQVSEILRTQMQNAVEFECPLTVDVSVGKSLFDL